MSDTATGGYLYPQETDLYGKALDHPVHDVIAGITGLDNALIRPRWQPEPPAQPAIDTDWCAFGIHSINRDPWAYIRSDVFRRHERIEFLCSFYGPGAVDKATLLADGIQVGNNRDQAEALGLFYGRCSDITPAADLVNERWVRRFDLTLEFRRQLVRQYGILTIASAAVDLYNDAGVRPNPQTIEVDNHE